MKRHKRSRPGFWRTTTLRRGRTVAGDELSSSLRDVDTRNIRDLVAFSADGPRRSDLFESERLWAEVICLEPNQQIGPMGDPATDAVFVIVAGEAVIQFDRSRKRLKQWEAALAPAGAEVTVTSASADPTVVLVVAAPPPTPHAVNG